MNGLRDARLHKALESAPDEGERPREDTRAAIRARAHSAVKPARTPWWKKLYAGAGGSRHMPWNAAFATVAVATLVTLLWHDREVPDAKTAAPEPSSTAAAPAINPQPVPPPAEPAAELKAAAPPQSRAKGVDSASTEKRAEARSSEQQRKQAAPVPSESARERASPPAAADQAGRESVGDLAKAPVVDAVPMPAPAAPVARSSPAPAAAAPPARQQNQSQPGEASMIVRVMLQGRTVQAPLVRPSVLSDLIDRASREATGTQPLQAPVELRVELAREQLTLGMLEIAGPQLRWTPMNGPARTATPDPALLQALREEIGRLAR
jgi:hypothetical protein